MAQNKAPINRVTAEKRHYEINRVREKQRAVEAKRAQTERAEAARQNAERQRQIAEITKKQYQLSHKKSQNQKYSTNADIRTGTLKAGKIDTPLALVIFILVIFGLVMVFSASAPAANEQYSSPYYYVSRQAMFAAIGFVAMFFIARVDYRTYRLFAKGIAIFGFAVLFTVYIPGFGRVINGARRWVNLGFTTFQPSEISKIAIIIAFAWGLSKYPERIGKFWKGLVPYLLVVGAFACVLMLEPHLSGTIVIVLTAAVMLLLGGAKLWHFINIGVLAAPAVWYMIISEPYRLERLIAFTDPFKYKADEGFQVVQSLYAIGSGGIFGLGLGLSHQKQLYLPEPQNDFIFAIICEELGLFGALAVIALFSVLIWRGFRIAQKAPDIFSSLLAAGITTLIAVQMAINVAVVTSSVPVTGMALPFFSYGGTSLLILMCSMGILLNISRFNKGT